MKILMVLTSYFPPDSRVEKEAISLLEEGHEVHIVCYSKLNQKNTEEFKSILIHRINCSDFFINKLSALALIYSYYFRKWKKEIEKIYYRYKFDAIHVHDLPLSKVGYYFKKKFGCKLICDQHEFYSDWIKKTAHMNTRIGKIVSLLSNWKKYEKMYLKRADLVITVATPLEDNYRKKYHLMNNQIITIPNTPAKNIYQTKNVKKEIVDRYKNDFIIFYAGGIDILRGIDTAIIAMVEIRKEIPHARLLLCGKIVKPYDPFITAEKYRVSDLLTFEGWIPEEELPSYIAASDICFHIPPETTEVNNTIATKIYQYAMMKKPIIVSNAKMMKDFVEKNNLGISIHSETAKEFTDAVLNIYNNHTEINHPNLTNLYWEKTVEPLLSYYKILDKQ